MSTLAKVQTPLQPPVRSLDDQYPAFEALVAARVAGAAGPLFTTNTTGLFDTLLANLPPEARQHYDCNCCRRFVDTYGGLVTIDAATGVRTPVLWDPFGDYPAWPTFWNAAVAALCRTVAEAKVNGVFLSSDATWGTPSNQPGPGSKYAGLRTWTHLHGENPSVWKGARQTAGQRMAELAQDFQVLISALTEYRADAAAEAVRVLESDALGRSEKALELGKWFAALRAAWETDRGPARTNRVWRAVATAPPGWAHVKNTIIGTLLDDLQAGLDFPTVKARWEKKVHPLQYQRPTALSEGNLKVAEKLIQEMGAADSLKRRFARLDEVTAFWRPSGTEAKPVEGGVFGHLRARAGAATPVKPLDLPPKVMTWVRFAAEVLPTVGKLDVLVPSRGNFYALVTAAVPDAPPVLQWDGLEGLPRNPVSFYVYVSGSAACKWGLVGGTWEPVAALATMPSHWQRPDLFRHQPEGLLVVIEEARDTYHTKGGGFFIEDLRSEYRPARAAIEAYVREAPIADREAGNANGLAFQKNGSRDCRLRATGADGVPIEYVIDRWE